MQMPAKSQTNNAAVDNVSCDTADLLRFYLTGYHRRIVKVNWLP